VTTVVVAIITLVTNPSLVRNTFLRDVLFYIGGILGVAMVINDGEINLLKALLLLAYYLL
jgi:Ca2+/Na+ antiporter